MNIWESYMECVDNNRKCSFNEPLPFNMYDEYAKAIPESDKQKDEKLKQLICKGNNGNVVQCCNPRV